LPEFCEITPLDRSEPTVVAVGMFVVGLLHPFILPQRR
jgi:hypothetical protein